MVILLQCTILLGNFEFWHPFMYHPPRYCRQDISHPQWNQLSTAIILAPGAAEHPQRASVPVLTGQSCF